MSPNESIYKSPEEKAASEQLRETLRQGQQTVLSLLKMVVDNWDKPEVLATFGVRDRAEGMKSILETHFKTQEKRIREFERKYPG